MRAVRLTCCMPGRLSLMTSSPTASSRERRAVVEGEAEGGGRGPGPGRRVEPWWPTGPEEEAL